MTKKKKTEDPSQTTKPPPATAIKSVQMDLFSEFLANDIREVSNTVEYWERIPKYFFTTKQIKSLRTQDGLARPYEYKYKVKDRGGRELPYDVVIQPALIKQTDGSYKAFFPTKTEEMIEEVLKKIFTEQNLGIHDPKNAESWVKFSYSMIRKELYRTSEIIQEKRKREKKEKYQGVRLRFDQIKHSLDVMSKCVLTVYENGKEIYTGAILQDYCSVDRSEYLTDTNALHVARLPVFISHAVNTLQYRQFNYLRYMECKEQLTRFIYKRLINRFVNANYINDYHFLYSDIKQTSGLLSQSVERNNRQKILSSLEELKERGVLISYEAAERRNGRKVIDVVYTVTAHRDFITEQKAANKRANEHQIKAKNQGIDVDKLPNK